MRKNLGAKRTFAANCLE